MAAGIAVGEPPYISRAENRLLRNAKGDRAASFGE